ALAPWGNVEEVRSSKRISDKKENNGLEKKYDIRSNDGHRTIRGDRDKHAELVPLLRHIVPSYACIVMSRNAEKALFEKLFQETRNQIQEQIVFEKDKRGSGIKDLFQRTYMRNTVDFESVVNTNTSLPLTPTSKGKTKDSSSKLTSQTTTGSSVVKASSSSHAGKSKTITSNGALGSERVRIAKEKEQLKNEIKKSKNGDRNINIEPRQKE
ncbi:hypothetical protein BIW11_07374, partial [Tropilaelaps mercedesae]